MSTLDSEFLYLEDGVVQMHIGACAIFEGPAPTYDEFVALTESKLPLVPRYRQKVKEVPLGFGRPVWVDDPHFTMQYHVRHSALPSPGGGVHQQPQLHFPTLIIRPQGECPTSPGCASLSARRDTEEDQPLPTGVLHAV